jgi:integrase
MKELYCYLDETGNTGMDIFTLKKLLGHEYLDTTEIYINTSMAFDRVEYFKSRGGIWK